MTQEEKQLLLKDLCARFPYGVKLHIPSFSDTPQLLQQISDYETIEINDYTSPIGIDKVKPYLRPMSSMTEEEKEELLNLIFDKESKYFYINKEGLIDGKTSSLMKDGLNYPAFCPINIVKYTDWLNSHYFDYRGLIPKGLAIKAPEGMYHF